MSQPIARFHHLDTLRFLFAMVIVAGHLFNFETSFPKGALAVDFFFLLSGFVLAHLLLHRPMSWIDFTVGRIARLYPLHILTLLAMTGVWLFTGDGQMPEGDSPRMLILNLGMAQTILPGGWLSFNAPSWSISVEFYANILVLYAVCRMKAWRSALVIAILIYGLLLAQYGMFDEKHTHAFGPISAGLARCIAGMLLGYFLYEVYNRFNTEQTGSSQTSFIWMSLLQAALVISITWLILLPRSVTGNMTVLILSAAMILAFTLRRGLVSDILAWPGVSWLGALSYGVYLWHSPLIYLFERLGFNIHYGTLLTGNIPTLIVYHIVLLLLSGLTYIIFEKPAKRLINQTWRNRKIKRTA